MSELIRFDFSGAFGGKFGLAEGDLRAIVPRFESVRREVLDVDLPLMTSGTVPAEKQPLDAGFIELPRRMLSAYHTDRVDSELGRILGAAKRLRDVVDRVVVLGIGGSYMGAWALMNACCQPYFNELSRGDRGGRPRMYFEGNNLDNDSLQGLLHLLRQPPAGVDRLENDWGIVVVSKSGGTLETAVAFRVFLAELQRHTGDRDFRPYVVPVTGQSGKLAELCDALGIDERFLVPDGVGGRFSIFSAVGLLPAAILGLDIVALLKGAIAMNEHFSSAEPAENVVLNYVAVNHLLEERGALTRVLSVWNKSLEYVGLWHDQLLAESLGKAGRGALPLTTVNTRDLHSRAQQHQQGRNDKVFNNLIVDTWRFDPVPVGMSSRDQDDLNRYSQRTYPELISAAIVGTNQALHDDGRPTTDIVLPKVDEFYLGQLFQMLMLATVVEGRLIGINPYGQPGVEKYKTNMRRLLDAQ